LLIHETGNKKKEKKKETYGEGPESLEGFPRRKESKVVVWRLWGSCAPMAVAGRRDRRFRYWKIWSRSLVIIIPI
jgi:hypothetical protein